MKVGNEVARTELSLLVRNDDVQIKLRRFRDMLAVSGAAVIAFYLWDLLKVLVGMFLGKETFAGLLAGVMEGFELSDPGDYKVVRIVAGLFIALVAILACLIIFYYHYYIGIHAYKEGRQRSRKKNNLYLALTVLSLLMSAWVFFPSVGRFFVSNDDTAEQIGLATLFVELTTLLNYVFLLFAAYKVRKLEKEAS
ncbi:MAG: hypothetical protein K6C95_09280 [Lachnospiraceae bacterium]|nr:hypothetical protein [Lachnospiraceae bacterium]